MKASKFFSFSLPCVIIFSMLNAGCEKLSRSQIETAQNPAVIYGEDNRQDINQVNNQDVKKIARSTIALIAKELMTLDKQAGVYRFLKPAMSLPLCQSERFRQQSTWAHCSGSLIASDLILTAGHCVIDEEDCRSARYVFDYELSGSEQVFLSVPANQVYGCAELVYTTAKKGPGDMAIVRLDRKVEDRSPLKIATQELSFDDQVMMIGHPSGYPKKVTFDGKIRKLSDPYFFTVAIDAYTSNSGSSVFNQKTHEIVGVLSRGEQDYIFTDDKCLISKICAENECSGEDVTRIEEVKKHLPAETLN